MHLYNADAFVQRFCYIVFALVSGLVAAAAGQLHHGAGQMAALQ